MTSINKIDVGSPIRVQGHILVPIEKTSIVCDSDGTSCQCFCSKQPIALVVKTGSNIHAYDIEAGGRLAIGELKNRVPEIERYLEQSEDS